MGVCNCSMFCCTLLYVHSSIAIILMGKRELVALLNLSSWCLVMVERLFLAVPRGCLRFVIVVFMIILTYYFSFKHSSSVLLLMYLCMYECMPHMCIFVTALSSMPLFMLCRFPYGLYSILDLFNILIIIVHIFSKF